MTAEKECQQGGDDIDAVATIDDLKRIRLQALLTQQTLGDRLGINASTISHYENNERKISLLMAIKWIEVCSNVSINPKKDRQLKLWAKYINHQYAAQAALFELITDFKPPKMKEVAAIISGH